MSERKTQACQTSEPPVLSCHHLTKTFHDGASYIEVLKDINFTVQRGECVAIVGPSGAGKSTFLHLLGGLDSVTTGQVRVAGLDITQLNDKKRSQTRNQYLGFIYQFHHLLAEFTVLENICIPLLLRGEKPRLAALKASALLKKMGLLQRQTHKLGELSGGERQRTAIARALVTEPCCVLADEPTGNLDSHTAEQVYQTLLELNQTSKTSLVIVTHDHQLAQRMDRVLQMENACLRPV